MSVSHEDLVGHALAGLDADEQARVESALDDGARERLERIRAHLALHEQAPEIMPAARIWRRIEARLRDPRAAHPLRRRLALPAAAAALVVAALLLHTPPDPMAVTRLHGALTRAPDGAVSCRRVSRIRLGDGVTVTLDANTTVLPLAPERLALKAGRIFLEVDRNRRGFTVVTSGLEVATTGTAFMVEPLRVAVETGRVRVTFDGGTRAVGAGEEFSPSGLKGPGPRAWFGRLTMSARILTRTLVEIVLRNEMPDPITLAPPTGGEPFLFASFSGRDHPLPVRGFAAPLALDPDASRTFRLRLPLPLPEHERLFVSSPSLNLRTEARR